MRFFFATALLLNTSVALSGESAVSRTPHAQRSTPGGSTLFTLLPAAQTGLSVENRYADPKMWTEHYQELAYGAIGTGVAIGDFDNDGRPDVFVVSKTEVSRLFRNLGDWKFEDVTARARLDAPAAHAAEYWRQGAAFADVNNDGWLDLYVCRFGAPNLLYVNQGDGTFAEEAAARGLAVTDASGMAAFCDFDRDGDLDVYLLTSLLDATKKPKGQPDLLFRNDGKGVFTDITAEAGISGDAAGHSATWWDFDRDGWPDLYVANDYDMPDRLYRNQRDGTFIDVTDRVLPHTAYYAMGADLGDVNNDGRLDLFVADMAASTHEKDQRGMAGSRARAQRLSAEPAKAPQYMRNMLYVHTGTDRFLEAAYLAGLPATDWTWSPRFEDLDNDGRIDLHVTNGMTREYHNADLLDRLMGLESQTESRGLVRSSPTLAEANFAFRNLGELRFEDMSAAWGLNQRGVSFGSAFGDLDGDGDLDLVYGNYLAGPTVLRNDSQQGHRLTLHLRGRVSNRFGVGSTVELTTRTGKQVRQLVLARGYGSTSEPIVHFGLGEDDRVEKLTVTWPSGRMQSVDDVSPGFHYVVTEPEAGVPAPESASATKAPLYLQVGRESGLGVRSGDVPPLLTKHPAFLPLVQGMRSPTLVTGDLDGDGAEEVVVGGTSLEDARILRANTDGTFSPLADPLPTKTLGLSDGPILLLDADGSGTLDLLVTKAQGPAPVSGSAPRARLFLNDGKAGFRQAEAGAVPESAIYCGGAATADLNGDQRPDVFLGARPAPGLYPLVGRSGLWVNHGGRFEDVTDVMAPGLRHVGIVTAALFSDADADGWPDLLIALEWGGVRFWRNEQGKRFVDATDAAGFARAGQGWWTCLASGDFNRDGKPDFVAGNRGLNTRYAADAAQPALLFHGDLGGAAPFMLEAFHEGDRIFPRLSRGELAAKTPAVVKRFPRTDAYARATLSEIIPSERLSAARKFSVTQTQSGVFLSDADGRYVFQPFPRLAQIAPTMAALVGDFDGDGLADVFLAQNDFSPVEAIGRFGGGLGQLLRGDGRGNFDTIGAAESGLSAEGHATAAVALRAGSLILIGQHNDTVRVFRCSR